MPELSAEMRGRIEAERENDPICTAMMTDEELVADLERRDRLDETTAASRTAEPPPAPDPPEEAAAAEVIDLDAAPFIPEGWSVEEHRSGGKFAWDAAKVALHLAQALGGSGHALRNLLKGKPVLNANALDFLFARPHLIPDEWKGKRVFFWGTVYRGRGGSLYVRYLYWDGDRWHWNSYFFDGGWYDVNLAAVRAGS